VGFGNAPRGFFERALPIKTETLTNKTAMEILYLLVGCSVIVAAVFLGGFLWSVKSGQYDDLYTPAVRILFDNAQRSDKNTLTKTTISAHSSDTHTHDN
jgi:cbb3-type cytochrome oxidase maturation protein